MDNPRASDLRMHAEALARAAYVMVSRKVDAADQKVQDFNEGLRQITADGTLEEIMQKYGYR